LRTVYAFSIFVWLSRIRICKPGVRQPVQPHTYARRLVFKETLAQPDLAGVNFSDVVTNMFYSLF